MQLAIYQVDAFSSEVFGGNPAAVCPLHEWLSEDLMLKIAQENNLSETAFYKKNETNGYDIRWFTPTSEVDLCGHATLSAAYILYTKEGYLGDQIIFSSYSGQLVVTRNRDNWFCLDFPTDSLHYVSISNGMLGLFNIEPIEIWKGKTDYLFIYENEQQIKTIIPNIEAIKKLDSRGVIVSAKGEKVDFVSRFFAPKIGIDEDPVTGSTHTSLIPYWSEILEKQELVANQLSERGGLIKCKYCKNRVAISGQCILYLSGFIFLPQ